MPLCCDINIWSLLPQLMPEANEQCFGNMSNFSSALVCFYFFSLSELLIAVRGYPNNHSEIHFESHISN